MSFLSPVFLWALPLIGIPVMIHFFARKQRERIRWGAMEFLMASAVPRRRFLRLTDLLLMLLRVAIVLAIVAALAQPMVAHRLGTRGPRDVILILDNSMSTARRIRGETVFEQELKEAAKLIGQLESSDVVRVLLASPRPEWLNDSPVSAASANGRELLARLQEVKPNAGAADFLESVQEAIKAEPAGKEMTRFITIVTDGQARSWRSEAQGAWSALQSFVKKASTPVSLSVLVAGNNSEPMANLTVENLSAARAVVGAGQPVTLTASVKNTGTVASQPASLTWKGGEQAIGISKVPALQPGAGVAVNVSQLFANTGLFKISCSLAEEDDLPVDNAAHYLVEVTREISVLVVEGEPHSDPVQSDTHYFLSALNYNEDAKESARESIFKPKMIGYQQLQGEDISPIQCVVLANVPRLSAEAVQKLARYVSSGGGLWIALGDQADLDSFNQLFFEKSAGLSPVRLLAATGNLGDTEKFTAVVPPGADHPSTALLSDIQRLDIDRVRIYRRNQFETDGVSDGTALLRVEGGAPLAVEKTVGRGRVIVQAIPLGLAWSNFPLTQSYVVMAHEWLWYLTEPGLVKRNLRAGELIQVSRPIDSSTGSGMLGTPLGREAHLVGEEEGGRMEFRYSKTLYPGDYELNVPDAKGAAHVEKFLVSRDPLESDVTPLSQEQIQFLTKTGGLAFDANPFSQQVNERPVATARTAFAQWVLLALVLLMAMEAIFVFWMARQRRSKAQAVVMESGFQV